jgi:hypothetical protein
MGRILLLGKTQQKVVKWPMPRGLLNVRWPVQEIGKETKQSRFRAGSGDIDQLDSLLGSFLV